MAADIREDQSEVIHYDNPEFPVFCRFNQIPGFCVLRDTSFHWHDDIEFIYVVKGNIIQHINGGKVILSQGEGIFINSNQIHVVENNNVDVDLYCMIFKPTLLCSSQYMENKYVSPITHADSVPFYVLKKSVPWQEEILDKVKRIVEYSMEEKRELCMVSELNLLWDILYKNLLPAAGENNPEKSGMIIFKKMMEYIQREYNNSISLKDICKVGGVGKTKCAELFMQYVNMPPIEYLICFRLEKSAIMLRDTDRTISEIAFFCGFSGASYYTECFKKRVGCTPNEYRRKEKNE